MKAGKRCAEIALCAVLSLTLAGFLSPQVAFAKIHTSGGSGSLAPSAPSGDIKVQPPSVGLGDDGDGDRADESPDSGGAPGGDGEQADESSDSGGASDGDGEQQGRAPDEEKAPVKTKVVVNNNASGGDLPLGVAAIIVLSILVAAVTFVRHDESRKG